MNKIDCICQVCPAARQTRFFFPHSSIKTIKPFQLLHVDLWGPYHVATHNKYNMFVTIVDDYSKHTWVHFVKHKSNAVVILKDFVAYADVQFGGVVMAVRCDNAKELTEGEILRYYNSKGIMLQKSCSSTPQQNGVVERKHRHLMETTRSLYIQSKVPVSYWNESMLSVVHIINRIPLKSIQNLTPYEKLFGKPPNLDHLRVFGCLYFVSTLKTNRTKLDPRASPCVFLGYPSNHKAYKVLDLTTHKIIISRDVVFHEKHFPFHFSTSPLTPSKSTFPIFLPESTNFLHL